MCTGVTFQETDEALQAVARVMELVSVYGHRHIKISFRGFWALTFSCSYRSGSYLLHEYGAEFGYTALRPLIVRPFHVFQSFKLCLSKAKKGIGEKNWSGVQTAKLVFLSLEELKQSIVVT